MQRLFLQSSLLAIIFIGLTIYPSMAQVSINDLEILRKEPTDQVVPINHNTQKLKVHQAINPLYWMYKGSLRTYQKVLSPQIASSCIYEISCSRFSDQLVSEFGLLKGFFLSIDRITRCNRAYHAEASPLRKNHEGRIIESVKDLAKKDE